MLPQSSLRFFCRGALTVASVSVLATIVLPSQVLSLTTQAETDLQNKNLEQTKAGTSSFSNQLSGIKKSTFLIAKDDDDDNKPKKHGHDDHKPKKHERDDDRDHKDRQDEQYYQSSKVFKSKDWNCLFKSGRLVNSNQRALVLQLDILEKPITRYANVVYTVYARQNNRWVQFYSSTGSRLIQERSGQYYLQPEVIEFNQMRLGNLDLSRSELKFVTQIRYDSASRRDDSVVFEDVRNYRDITEISSVRQITNISTSTTTTTQTAYDHQNNNQNNDQRRDDDDRQRQGDGREQNRKSSKAFRIKDWNCLFKSGRLVNSNQRALVLQLDILEKPITRYANVVYTVYARQNNRWVQFYSSTGSRLIQERSGKYSLQPEVIEFNQLRLGNLNLSRSELKFVTQIRYDSASRRDDSVVFEDVRNYSEITEISSVRQITTYR